MCNTTINGKSRDQRQISNFPIKCSNKYIKIQIISNTLIFGLLVNEFYQITALEILQCVVVLYFTFNYTYVLCTLYLYNIVIFYAIDNNSYEPTKIMCNGYNSLLVQLIGNIK